jgi:putative SOS response-associated peptidase YedK
MACLSRQGNPRLSAQHICPPKKVAAGKQPYAIALADRGLMALAGLWENWRSPAGEWVRSFATVRTTPNDLCAELHNRVPVVLGRQVWSEWLGEEPVVLAGEHPGRQRQTTTRA